MDISSPVTVEGTEDPAALLARADGLRDRREWIEAAVAYAAYLRLRPEDWPIWVQYGHCMKESGDVKAALLLYREAERLQPDDADLHIQIGHALKLLGRIEEAYQEYARALSLDPGSEAARAELLAPPPGGAPPPPPRPPEPIAAPAPAPPAAPAARVASAPPPAPPDSAAPPAPPLAAASAAPVAVPQAAGGEAAAGQLVFDASDLLDYFRANRAPTGIQRVQLNVIGAVLDQVPAEGAAIVVFDAAAGAWKPLPADSFRRLALLSRHGAAAEDPEWTGAVAGVVGQLLQAAPFRFAPDSRLVNLGTSWWLPDYLRRVREAKARFGLRYIPFLHDCIPLVVPEHCAAGLVDEFARWFAGICLLADRVLCNSACTEADFRRLLARVAPGREVPTSVIRLDAATPPDPGATAAGRAFLPLPLRAGRPYVLFVGTIEARKNHLMVFNAWLSLLRRLGPETVPDLVCVGKRGWLAEAALTLHANSPALREKVHLLHDIPDTALEALYRGCLFTLYNSFYEGWGLPVTESLAHGKVPLVPDHSALQESGGAGAVFFEPQSEPDLLAKLERLILDHAFREAQEARIAREVRLRSWPELTAELLREVAPEAVPAGVAQPDPALLRLGAIHPLRLLPGPEPSAAMAVPDLLREGPAWSVPEPWGVWTLPGTARLRLPVPPGTAGPVRVHLDLLGPPKPLRFGLRAVLPGRLPAPYRSVEIGAGETLACVLDLPEAGEGAVIEFDCAEGVPLGGEKGPDLRVVGVGVRAVMACRPDDAVARLDWLERMALPRLLRL